MYNEGDGVVQDYAAAFKWWFWGASLGSAYSQHNLAYLYILGHGVDPDFVRAHMWLNIVGAGGDKAARELRDSMAEDGVLSPVEVEDTQALARECMRVLTAVKDEYLDPRNKKIRELNAAVRAAALRHCF